MTRSAPQVDTSTSPVTLTTATPLSRRYSRSSRRPEAPAAHISHSSLTAGVPETGTAR